MAVIKPCPKCQHPLEIPQPPPAQIQCAKCGAVIRKKASPAEAVTATPPIAAASSSDAGTATPAPAHGSRPRAVLVLGMLGGLLLICVLPVAGLGVAWYFSSKEKKDEPSPPAVVKEENKTPAKIKTPPPPDPRIKIVQPNVDKGVAFLKSKVPDLKVMRGGYLGLNGLTLLECGVPPDDPAILQIAEFIRTASPTMDQIYDLSASLFFLNRWDESRPLDEMDRRMARTFALRIIAGQLSTGIWSYGGVVMNPGQEDSLRNSLEQGTYKPNGPVVRFPSMSNTQFAMLAIWGARKHGVPVRDPLLALAAYCHANQEPDGNWVYPGHGLKASSTCVGLIALAIEVALLEGKEFASIPRKPDGVKKKADADKAFAFVAKTIGRKTGDPGGGPAGRFFNADAIGDLYYLWTLERVGVIYSKDLIGGKNWYDWGYPIVLQAQQQDGSWLDGHGPQIDTCFALLFLKRSNIARDLTEFIRTRGGMEAIP